VDCVRQDLAEEFPRCADLHDAYVAGQLSRLVGREAQEEQISGELTSSLALIPFPNKGYSYSR
jgi:hypothetical protein